MPMYFVSLFFGQYVDSGLYGNKIQFGTPFKMSGGLKFPRGPNLNLCPSVSTKSKPWPPTGCL